MVDLPAMRIVYFSPHPTHDIVSNVGYSTHQREMIHALRELGHEVIPVIVGGSTADELPPETQRGGSSRFTQLVKKWVPPIIWRTIKDAFWMRHDRRVAEPLIKAALEKHRPDLVYERSEYCLKAGAKWCQHFGVKHILEVNAPCVEEWIQFEGSSFLTRKAHAIERYKFQHTTGLCPVSSPLGEFLTNNYQVPTSRIRVIPNAIRLDTLKVNPRAKEEIRSSFGWNQTDLIIGFVGSILKYHGVDNLLKAFISLKWKHDHLRLLIVGDGVLLKDLKETVDAYDLNDSVRFTGKVPHNEVFVLIDSMDICVSPKHSWYGSPIKIFEYGAMGKAIIAPRTQNIKDILKSGETAWLIDEEDLIEDALERLVLDKSLRLKLGMNVKIQIVTNHTWKANAESLVEFSQLI